MTEALLSMLLVTFDQNGVNSAVIWTSYDAKAWKNSTVELWQQKNELILSTST